MATARKPRTARNIVLVVLGAIALVLLIAVATVLPRLRAYQAHSRTAEASTQLYTLCTSVAALHDETGHWTAAGPQPKQIPRGVQVDFPKDPDFERLQFEPGKVRYQYQVLVEGNPDGEAKVRCLARGDLNGDGVASEATLEIDKNGMLRPVRWKNELE